MSTGGALLISCLEAQGVERAFCVPGESYLAALDALQTSRIEIVAARQEGGAAMMAEADGKLTGRPGICFVTRGPGATNAAAGVHIAKQDASPMILFVGQIGRSMRGRDAFQEVDYRLMFGGGGAGGLAKWVEEIDDADRLPEMINRAFSIAMNGRPGPVVLALPEDMLSGPASGAPGPRVEPADAAPTPSQIERLGALLAAAKRPFAVLGGARWSDGAIAAMREFAERQGLAVGCSFRRQRLFDHRHPHYAGDVGLGIAPHLKQRIAESDLLLLIGARFSENPSQGFSLLGIPEAAQKLVHVYPGPEDLGRIYAADLPIAATPGAFLEAAAGLPARGFDKAEIEAAHGAYLDWSTPQTATEKPGGVELGPVMATLAELAPEAMIANGAGNYSVWAHRYWRYTDPESQLAPISGSMGYGLPAAIAGKLRRPDREVIAFAGDGCFQMTGQEFGTAAQSGAAVIVIVADNRMWGTIRMHQERRYPGRVAATDLQNPDFAALARAYGGHGERVERTEDFAEAFLRARASGKPALLHLLTDPERIAPTTTLAALRGE